ncbi:MAG: UbiA prenyltransferase family protein [Pseudomonadota bacterium]
MGRLSPYINIARPDHWFKNVFMLPGVVLAVLMSPETLVDHWLEIVLGFVSLCLLASANYTINEWLDARYDRHHPVKKDRPSATGEVSLRGVLAQYVALLCIGLGLAWSLHLAFFGTAVLFLTMGVIYNVPPIRSKDVPYLDVLSEAINNPLRLVMGWGTIESELLPPSSILLSYWMGGAFLMGIKRLGEYRFIDDPQRAALYRKSFGRYNDQSLLLSSFFYALCASFFLAIFLIKYRIEFLLSFPLFAALFTWYLALGLKDNSPAQNPEKLFQERGFMLFVVFLVAAVVALFVIDIPGLRILLTRLDYT